MPPKTLFYLLFSIFILLISCKSQTFFSFEFIRLTFLACSRLPWLKTKIWLVFPPRVFPFPPLHHVWRPPNDTKNTTFIQIIIRKERKRRMVTTTIKKKVDEKIISFDTLVPGSGFPLLVEGPPHFRSECSPEKMVGQGTHTQIPGVNHQ